MSVVMRVKELIEVMCVCSDIWLVVYMYVCICKHVCVYVVYASIHLYLNLTHFHIQNTSYFIKLLITELYTEISPNSKHFECDLVISSEAKPKTENRLSVCDRSLPGRHFGDGAATPGHHDEDGELPEAAGVEEGPDGHWRPGHPQQGIHPFWHELMCFFLVCLVFQRRRCRFVLQEFIRLGCLSKLSGKGLQQRMFFLVRTLALARLRRLWKKFYKTSKKGRKAEALKSASCVFAPVQRLTGVHQPGDDPVQPVQGPRPAAPLRHGCKDSPGLLLVPQSNLSHV